MTNDEFSVEFWISGIVMFFNRDQVSNFGAPSMYYYKGALTQLKETILSELDFSQIWF